MINVSVKMLQFYNEIYVEEKFQHFSRRKKFHQDRNQRSKAMVFFIKKILDQNKFFFSV
jgi:hypothetical protein